MPEFYSETICNYQPKAQPYLDAIARLVKLDPAGRSWLIKGTSYEAAYANSAAAWVEQRQKRDPGDKNKAPFWANYWYEPC